MTKPAGQSCSNCISFNAGACTYETPSQGWPAIDPGAWCAHWNLLPDASSGVVQILPSYTVATLPSPPTAGMKVMVTDASGGLAWASTVVGGGTSKAFVWYNGTNWTVVSK